MDRDSTFSNGAVVETEQEPELRLGNPIELLRRHLWVVTLCLAAGIVLSFLYCGRAQPRYQSSAQVLVMQRDANLPADSSRVTAASQLSGTSFRTGSGARCALPWAGTRPPRRQARTNRTGQGMAHSRSKGPDPSRSLEGDGRRRAF